MQRIWFLLALILFVYTANAQHPTDTNYATRISSFEWMPNGKAILLGVVKHHRTNGGAPFFSKVILYNLLSRKLTPLFDDGTSLTVSPDGKTIAFLKRSDTGRTDIYFYNINTKQQTVLSTEAEKKYGVRWSPDGKNLVYNAPAGDATAFSTRSIWVLNLATKTTRQITKDDGYKSYDPSWSPDSKKIAYYLEKGDGRDQVWLTDISGSFYINLTNDTSTHNYYPSWMDENTIMYTRSPSHLMMINADGTNLRQIEGINSTPVKYNAKAGKLAYIKSEEENALVIFDWKKKVASVVLDGMQLMNFF